VITAWKAVERLRIEHGFDRQLGRRLATAAVGEIGEIGEVHRHPRDVVEQDDATRRQSRAQVRRVVVGADPPEERSIAEQSNRLLDRRFDGGAVRTGRAAPAPLRSRRANSPSLR